MLEEHLTIGTSLGDLTRQETFVLLGIDLGDKSFLRLEVEGHRVTLVFVVTHLEDRGTHELLGGVDLTCGMHKVTVETHVDLLTLEVHVLVFHLRLSIEMGQSRGGLVGQRVVGGIFHGRIDTVLTTAVDTVECQRVVDGLVMLIDSEFNGVHRRRVTLDLDRGFGKCFRNNSICRDAVIILLGPTGFRNKRHRHLCHHQKDDKQHQYNG